MKQEAEDTGHQDGPRRPLPVVDEVSAPFWEHCRDHRLAVQRCQECGRYQHPPRPTCSACQSDALAFEVVSGTATLRSWAVVRHKTLVAGFEPAVPYVVLLAELCEQGDLLFVSDLPVGELPDDGEKSLRIGAELTVSFLDYEGYGLPRFRPAQS